MEVQNSLKEENHDYLIKKNLAHPAVLGGGSVDRIVLHGFFRESEHKGNLTYEKALTLARSARGEDPEGYRAEFLRLVETARDLAGK